MKAYSNYEAFKRLYEEYGGVSYAVEYGSCGILEIDENTYEATFLNEAGNGDYFQDPSFIIEVDDILKEVRVQAYYNNFANAVIEIQRSEEPEEDLDEHLELFLKHFEAAVKEESKA